MSLDLAYSALEPIQDAIVAKLKGDDTLKGMVTGIFDFRGVPIGQLYPYVTVGDSTEIDDSTFDTDGYEDACTLHIWSIQPNTQECQQIFKQIQRLLNHQPLALAGMSHVGTWLDMAQTLGDPDDTRLTHMPVRYRIGAGEN